MKTPRQQKREEPVSNVDINNITILEATLKNLRFSANKIRSAAEKEEYNNTVEQYQQQLNEAKRKKRVNENRR